MLRLFRKLARVSRNCHCTFWFGSKVSSNKGWPKGQYFSTTTFPDPLDHWGWEHQQHQSAQHFQARRPAVSLWVDSMGVSNGLPKNRGAMRGTKKMWIWVDFSGPFCSPSRSFNVAAPVEPVEPVAFFLTFATTMTSLHASALASELKNLWWFIDILRTIQMHRLRLIPWYMICLYIYIHIYIVTIVVQR